MQNFQFDNNNISRDFKSVPSSIYCYITIIGIYITSFAEGFDIGPVSVKVYITVFLLLTLLIRYSFGKKIFFSNEIQRIFLLYLLFVGWRIFTRVITGQSFVDVIEIFLKRDLVALTMFLSISVYSKNKKDLELFVNALILNLVISTIFAIAQYLNIQIAWDIQKIINPTERENVVLTLVPGLYYMPFTYGYYIAAIFPLILSQLFYKTLNPFLIINAIIVFIGIIILQQRAAIIACGIVLLIYILFLKVSKFHKVCILFLITILTLVVIFHMNSDSSGMYSFSRFSNKISDDPRNKLMAVAIEYIKSNLVFGISQEYIEIAQKSETNLAPHNIVLNLLLTTGIPGLVLASIVTVYLFMFVNSMFFSAVKKNNLLGIGICLGLTAFFINSFFHNSNFFIGDYLVWWIFGLIAVQQKIEPMT